MLMSFLATDDEYRSYVISQVWNVKIKRKK